MNNSVEMDNFAKQLFQKIQFKKKLEKVFKLWFDEADETCEYHGTGVCDSELEHFIKGFCQARSTEHYVVSCEIENDMEEQLFHVVFRVEYPDKLPGTLLDCSGKTRLPKLPDLDTQLTMLLSNNRLGSLPALPDLDNQLTMLLSNNHLGSLPKLPDLSDNQLRLLSKNLTSLPKLPDLDYL